MDEPKQTLLSVKWATNSVIEKSGRHYWLQITWRISQHGEPSGKSRFALLASCQRFFQVGRGVSRHFFIFHSAQGERQGQVKHCLPAEMPWQGGIPRNQVPQSKKKRVVPEHADEFCRQEPSGHPLLSTYSNYSTSFRTEYISPGQLVVVPTEWA